MLGGMQKMTESAADAAKAMTGAAGSAADKPRATSKKTRANGSGTTQQTKPETKPDSKADSSSQPASGVVDPLQWWGALTQQFQQIATSAMKDVATQTAVDTARNMATGMAKDAAKSAGAATRKAAGKRAARKKSG